VENYQNYLKREFPSLKELSPLALKEVKMALDEAARSLIVRHWLEVKRFLLEYILKSPEVPMGVEVDALFSRDEYQGESGNLPHMHMLITLCRGYETPEGRAAIQKLVRGFVDDIVTDDEVEDLIKEGVFKDYNDYRQMKEEARNFLVHHHSSRCMRRPDRGSMI
jgi:hypothetical protein